MAIQLLLLLLDGSLRLSSPLRLFLRCVTEAQEAKATVVNACMLSGAEFSTLYCFRYKLKGVSCSRNVFVSAVVL